MNQEKIGKLIAELRKKKGLTQSELGEMVGVGDRAVSKWERGITTPNIAIINELSEILGISSNELLAGELEETSESTNNSNVQTNNNPKSFFSKYKKHLLIIIGIISIIAIAYFIISNHQKVYFLKDYSEEYNVEGKVVFAKNKVYILINGISFYDTEFENTTIINYEYRIRSNNRFIFRGGYIANNEKLLNDITIKEFLETFKISYSGNEKINCDELVQYGLNLQLTFLTSNGASINKKIKISLIK